MDYNLLNTHIVVKRKPPPPTQPLDFIPSSSSSKPSRHLRSGSNSDGNTAVPVDMKRLLSKPALPSSSGSAYSVPSDAEPPSPPSNRTRLPTLDLPSPSGSTSIPRTRNVLKRRQSANKGSDRPASQNRNTIINSTTPSPTPRNLTPTVTTTTITTTTTPTTPNSTRNPSPTNPFHVPPSPSILTPAAAVAHTYKEQESRSECSGNENSIPSRPPSQRTDEMPTPIPEPPPSPIPYYTVFGDTSARIIAMGGSEDDILHNSNVQLGFQNTDWSTTIVAGEKEKHKRLHKAPLGPRTLSKKISGKWKKNSSPSITVHQRRTASPDSQRRMSLTITPIDIAPSDSTKSLPTASPQLDTSTPERDKGEKLVPRRAHSELMVGGKIWSLMKRISTGGLRDKFEQGQHVAPPVPPIPKKHYSQDDTQHRGVLSRLVPPSRKASVLLKPSKHGTRSSSPGSSEHTSSQFSGRAHSQSTCSSSSSFGEEVPPLPAPIGQHIMSPRELYRLSRDHEDAKGWERDHESNAHHPESPKSRAQQQQQPHHHHRAQLLDPSHDDYWVIESPDEQRLSSLPFPPPRTRQRSRAKTDDSVISSIISPTIPAFSTMGAINTFGARKPVAPVTKTATPVFTEVIWQGDGDGAKALPPLPPPTPPALSSSMQPPVRPAKSAKRMAAAALAVARQATTSSSGAKSPPVAAENHQRLKETDKSPRRSISDSRSSVASTVRAFPRPRSSSLSALRKRRRNDEEALPLPPVSTSALAPLLSVSVPSPSPSPHSGRSLPSAGLTEEEKAEKWDDLLARSERAGGTLHIRSSMLVSDLVGVSSSSESSTVELDDGDDAYT